MRKDDSKGFVFTLFPKDSSISVSCGPTQPVLKPEQSDKHFYRTEQCQEESKGSFHSVRVGATLSDKQSSSTTAFTLNMPTGNRNKAELCYSCETTATVSPAPPGPPGTQGPSGNQRPQGRGDPKISKCIVKIRKKQGGSHQNPDPQEENGDGLKVSECTDDTVTSTASTGTPLVLKCEAGMSLLPLTPDRDFDARTGDCGYKVAQTSLVGAELQPSQDTEKEKDVYTLKINKDPEHDT
ncbi:hypothetical protein BESB_033810 [Besnoitia besnoiti]|uniref:SAG-related sequence n=1 Tax=Besnoitia besnoiti TaxID=94643 RepID=A0A2A9MMB2_BESBE|nr:hypothetical protein BESB_033810 [Besnoitia besnoiti]PFH36923.1 hypothetical protein BESB_033810 [Besnoitia besnoiti]